RRHTRFSRDWSSDVCSSDLLQRLASRCGIGRTVVLGSIPLDPVLQWQEQLITDDDVLERQIANPRTVEAFTELAARLTDDQAWEIGRASCRERVERSVVAGR